MSLITDDVQDILYQHIKASVLFSSPDKPNGGLYLDKRPQNSSMEDVVINVPFLSQKHIQQGYINLNVFVPNLSLLIDGVKDNSLPNTYRLGQLARLAKQALKKTWDPNGNWTFKLQQDKTFEDTGNNQHYKNFRIDFEALNLKEN